MMNILIDPIGIYFVLGALLLLVLKYFFNLKPRFVVPFSKLRNSGTIFLKICTIALIFLIILSFLNIQFLVGKTIETQKDIPIQILFDVSLSMTADDIKPSRFDAAKFAVSSLMKELNGYNISLITFSGIPFVYMPFSDDFKSMLLYRKGTDLTDFPPVNDFVGTAVGDALILSIQNLNKNDFDNNDRKIVVLITDGDSNIGYDPLQLIPSLQEENIVVFALGVGEQNYLIGYDYFDTPVKTSINTVLLDKLAEETGGKFYRILDEENFRPVFEEIIDIVRSQEKDLVVDKYWAFNRALYPIAALFLFVILWFRIRLLVNIY